LNLFKVNVARFVCTGGFLNSYSVIQNKYIAN